MILQPRLYAGAFVRGCMFIWAYRFPGLWRRFGGLWVHPRGGLTRGETGRGSTLNILKK